VQAKYPVCANHFVASRSSFAQLTHGFDLVAPTITSLISINSILIGSDKFFHLHFQFVQEKKFPVFSINLQMDYDRKLDAVEQEIKALENSEEYKTLAKKNRAWAAPKPTEAEKGEWGLLKEKLAELKKKEEFYQNAILSTNAHSVKKADSTRKKYKKDTAIKDGRLFLSTIAKRMWEQFGFPVEIEDSPTFGDVIKAAELRNSYQVRDYFRKREAGKVEADQIKDSNTEDEWIKMIEMDRRVNRLLHDEMVKNDDGSYRLVLESEEYKGDAELYEGLVKKWCPGKKVEVKDASSDSSECSI
jgi:hypothetical protein